jgi:hypothetical protein
MDNTTEKKYGFSTELHVVFRGIDLYLRHYVYFSKGVLLVRHKKQSELYKDDTNEAMQ